MSKLIQSFSIIILGLGSGFLFNRLVMKGFIPLNRDAAESFRQGMQRLALLGLNPVIFCGAIWSLDFSDSRYLLMPLVGIAALALGLALGLAGSRVLKLPVGQAGVHITCSSFTNIGSIGGLVVFMLLGESAFALVPIYKLGEEFWNYAVLFPIARSHGERSNSDLVVAQGGKGTLYGVLKVARDPFFLVSVASIGAGLAFNYSGIQRPAFYAPLNSLLVPTGTFLLLFAVGMRLRFRISRGHVRAAALVVVGKTLVVPWVILALAWILGLGQTPGGVGLKVCLVLAMMPVAFLGLVAAGLFRLDEDFANSLWLASNGALVVTVPLLAIVLPLLG